MSKNKEVWVKDDFFGEEPEGFAVSNKGRAMKPDGSIITPKKGSSTERFAREIIQAVREQGGAEHEFNDPNNYEVGTKRKLNYDGDEDFKGTKVN